MQWYPSPEGDQRIWYDADEIEQIASDELRRAGLGVSLSNPVSDLEAFIEVYLKASLDQYADLPEDVLGLTEFPVGRAPSVSINVKLTEARDRDDAAPGAVGRWRATLAHEASHIYLHRYLFDPQMAQLFGGRSADAPAPAGGLMRCLHRDVTPVQTGDWTTMRRRGDWREIQANRGMAALLMPKRIFRRLALARIADLGTTDLSSGSPEADTLAAGLAETFEVSKQAATIRLVTEGLLSDPT